MRAIVEALVQSAWFPVLPGPTRLALVQELAQDLARKRVWGMLTDWEWARVVRVAQVRGCFMQGHLHGQVLLYV